MRDPMIMTVIINDAHVRRFVESFPLSEGDSLYEIGPVGMGAQRLHFSFTRGFHTDEQSEALGAFTRSMLEIGASGQWRYHMFYAAAARAAQTQRMQELACS